MIFMLFLAGKSGMCSLIIHLFHVQATILHVMAGGYYLSWWPALIFLIKYGNEHEKRAWGMMVKSVRKDIECPFGALKGQWLSKTGTTWDDPSISKMCSHHAVCSIICYFTVMDTWTVKLLTNSISLDFIVQGDCMELHVQSIHRNFDEITAIRKQNKWWNRTQLLVNHYHEFRKSSKIAR